MTKKYTCYVICSDDDLGYVLEDSNKISKYYSSFSDLMEDVNSITLR